MAADRNALWAWTFVDELARAGVTDVCIAPGSRSAPLALAFAASSPVRTHVLIDERSAGFFAIGIALASGRPAAVVCTSGTAVANLFPAVIEARQSAIPLLLLTADRPHELRQSGANQSIDQIKIFGGQVNWFVEVPLPESDPSAITHRYLKALAGRALAQATGPPAGPVHLNFPFRKPLEPPLEQWTAGVSYKPSAGGRDGGEPFSRIVRGTRTLPDTEVSDLVEILQSYARGLIVVGPRAGADQYLEPLGEIAQARGYPVLADPLSGVRFSSLAESKTALCGGYEWYLDGFSATEAEVILRIGASPTSDKLERYIESQTDAIQIGLIEGPDWPDPSHRLARLYEVDLGSVCRQLATALRDRSLPNNVDVRWQETFSAAERSAWAAVDAVIVDSYCEGALAADVLKYLPQGVPLFCASSLPIRHLDQFARPTPKPIQLFANRGASGIDGTISSAAGVSAGTRSPVVLLIGDLAFHHDQNGLLAMQKFAGGSTIVVINNHGGGIFQRLPIFQYEPPFTDLFKTPINFEIEAITHAYGGSHIVVDSRADFLAAYKSASPRNKFRVIEFHSEIEQNDKVRLQILEQLKERHPDGYLD